MSRILLVLARFGEAGAWMDGVVQYVQQREASRLA